MRTSKTKIRVLFFSRGRGRGHAVPDMAIASVLCRRRPGIEVTFVSYGSGASVLRGSPNSLIGLDMPEECTYHTALRSFSAVCREAAPDWVIAHEEIAAITAAHLLGIPCVYMSAWAPPEQSIMFEALALADELVMLCPPGVFALPSRLRDRARHVGPIVRSVEFGREGRRETRRRLSIPQGAPVVLVVPGGWATEERAPIGELVTAAFNLLPAASKRLYWVGEQCRALVESRLATVAGATILPYTSGIDQLIVASDVVITKGTRGITYDSAALGVPTISLSFGHNPIDDLLVPRVRSNVALSAGATDAALLARHIRTILETPGPERMPVPFREFCRPEEVAEILLGHLDARPRPRTGGKGTRPRATLRRAAGGV